MRDYLTITLLALFIGGYAFLLYAFMYNVMLLL
jgi:hypothetical protein